MVLAERVAAGVNAAEDKDWPFIEGWAAELGLSGPDAAVRAAEPPRARGAETSRQPEAGA